MSPLIPKASSTICGRTWSPANLLSWWCHPLKYIFNKHLLNSRCVRHTLFCVRHLILKAIGIHLMPTFSLQSRHISHTTGEALKWRILLKVCLEFYTPKNAGMHLCTHSIYSKVVTEEEVQIFQRHV